MTNFSRAALNGCLARLLNEDMVNIHFNPAGENGWMEDVLIGFDNHEVGLAWSIEGVSLDGDMDYNIVEIL